MTKQEKLEFAKAQQARFWSKGIKNGGCLEWTAALDKDGYGKFSVTLPRLRVGKENQWHTTAHRLAYQLTHGLVEHGMLVLHECDNPKCFNPSHLKLGTQLINRTDAVMRGRTARGERHAKAKLTDEQAREVVRLRQRGIPINTIASQFGIGVSTAYQVGTLYWKHLSP